MEFMKLIIASCLNIHYCQIKLKYLTNLLGKTFISSFKLKFSLKSLFS